MGVTQARIYGGDGPAPPPLLKKKERNGKKMKGKKKERKKDQKHELEGPGAASHTPIFGSFSRFKIQDYFIGPCMQTFHRNFASNGFFDSENTNDRKHNITFKNRK